MAETRFLSKQLALVRGLTPCFQVQLLVCWEDLLPITEVTIKRHANSHAPRDVTTYISSLLFLASCEDFRHP